MSTENLDAEGEIDLFAIIAKLWSGRWWIAASVLLFTVVFAAAAFVMTPVYRASAVLVPASADHQGSLGQTLGSLGGLAAIAGINISSSGGTKTAESLAVLRSREFTEGFIADQQLLPVLYASKWDAKSNSWKIDSDKQPTLAQAYKYFDRLRTATEDKKTGLVKLQVEWRDPKRAAFWVNALIARVNAVMRARAIERTDAYIGYLQKELAATSAVETRNAIGRLMESQINERMLANVTEEYAFRVVDKALMPDAKDPAKPNRVLITVLGVIIGAFVGVVGVLVLATTKRV